MAVYIIWNLNKNWPSKFFRKFFNEVNVIFVLLTSVLNFCFGASHLGFLLLNYSADPLIFLHLYPIFL